MLGASTTVQVTISPAMQDTDYVYSVILTGASGGLSITSSSIVSASRVDVTVQAGVAYVAGAQVVVAATRF